MPSGSLIPDRQLTFSPDLAATIGLEEAILLQGIGPSIPRTGGRWHALVISNLERQFPFWGAEHIRELLNRLASLGIIALLPGDDRNSVRIAEAGVHQHSRSGNVPKTQHNHSSSQPLRHEPTQQTGGVALENRARQTNTSTPAMDAPRDIWRPSEPALDLLALNHGVDRQFALAQLATFERGAPDHTRDSRFRQHVMSAWRKQQSQHPAFEVKTPPTFDNQWHASEDAMEIMIRGGIDPEFIDSVRPEFILYWRERGGPPKEVNSKFIGWVRQRWTRFQAGLGHSTEPRPMTRNWQPSEQVFEVLALSGIDRDYARARVPEFVLYWGDNGELHTSWNSKFLQHVKHQWRREQDQETANVGQQGSGSIGGTGRTRDRSISDDLTDTSWAN